MGFLPDKLNKSKFVGALLASIGGMYFPPTPQGRRVEIRYKSAPTSKKPAAFLHPTKGWRGPGTVSRGTNRRRLVEAGAKMFYPKVNDRGRRLQHCANVLREQALKLSERLKFQGAVMGVTDDHLVDHMNALTSRADAIEPAYRQKQYN